MITYKFFRDHEGRIRRTRITDEERREAALYWVGFVGVCIAFAAILTIVSGILR